MKHRDAGLAEELLPRRRAAYHSHAEVHMSRSRRYRISCRGTPLMEKRTMTNRAVDPTRVIIGWSPARAKDDTAMTIPAIAGLSRNSSEGRGATLCAARIKKTSMTASPAMIPAPAPTGPKSAVKTTTMTQTMSAPPLTIREYAVVRPNAMSVQIIMEFRRVRRTYPVSTRTTGTAPSYPGPYIRKTA